MDRRYGQQATEHETQALPVATAVGSPVREERVKSTGGPDGCCTLGSRGRCRQQTIACQHAVASGLGIDGRPASFVLSAQQSACDDAVAGAIWAANNG